MTKDKSWSYSLWGTVSNVLVGTKIDILKGNDFYWTVLG